MLKLKVWFVAISASCLRLIYEAIFANKGKIARLQLHNSRAKKASKWRKTVRDQIDYLQSQQTFNWMFLIVFYNLWFSLFRLWNYATPLSFCLLINCALISIIRNCSCHSWNSINKVLISLFLSLNFSITSWQKKYFRHAAVHWPSNTNETFVSTMAFPALN